MTSKSRSVEEIKTVLRDNRRRTGRIGVVGLLSGVISIFVIYVLNSLESVTLVISIVALVCVLVLFLGLPIGLGNVLVYFGSDGYPHRLRLSDRIVYCLYSLSGLLKRYMEFDYGAKRYRKDVRFWLRRVNLLVDRWGIDTPRPMRERLDFGTEKLRTFMAALEEFSERLNYFVKRRMELPEDVKWWFRAEGVSEDGRMDHIEEGLRLVNETLSEVDERRDDLFTLGDSLKKGVAGIGRLRAVSTEEVSAFAFGYFVVCLSVIVMWLATGFSLGIDTGYVVGIGFTFLVMFVVPFLLKFFRRGGG